MKKTGLFISFEGIDGAGKSTHIEGLAATFKAQGRQVTLTREPGGTPLAEKLREMVLHDAMDSLTEALLIFAARRDHLQNVIEPALARGDVVLCDRFTDATYAYQAGGSGMDWARIAELERWVQGDLQPDLTLYFDLAPEIGKTRTRAAREPDRFEREQLDFYARVRAAYLRRAQEHPQRIRVIDAARTIPEIQAELEKIVATI